MDYDFCGWATKNDLRCSDGKVVKRDAFKVNDGKKVPLVWNHKHDSVGTVLGHALLENRDEGVYAYCKFNKTQAGKDAKEIVLHGDVVSLSIWANNIQQVGSDILHGVIREISLVLAGANPGAFIEDPVVHGVNMEDGSDEGIFYTGEGIEIYHAEDDENKKKKDGDEKPPDDESKSGETVRDVINNMTDKQKAAMAIIIEQVTADNKKSEPLKKDDEKEDNEMKHNMFQGSKTNRGVVISHSDMENILSDAKKLGTLSEAVMSNLEEGGVLAHSIDTTGMETSTGTQTYGINDMSMLFPEPKSLNTPPEFISRNMTWVQKLMSKVHRTPFSRIKSMFADITEDEARAKGYIKGKQKKEEVFSTLKRSTTPTTVYKKQKFDRDDIIDIVDFKVVAWIKAEMRIMLDEEIARAMLIGDGRPADSDDKINEQNIRPIAKDVPLFNVIVKVSVPANADETTIAKETIKAIIRSRKRYKGSGRPDFWTTEDSITEMLLLEDGVGRTLYETEAALATKLRVNEIIPVEPMEGQTVVVGTGDSAKTYPLIGIIANMNDYNVGADKGGNVEFFDDFDLNFNQQLYLLETRMSGALIKPFSAMTVVLDKTDTAAG